MSGINPKDAGIRYEEVYFYTQDNVRLHGWFIPKTGENSGEDKRAIILLHGWPVDKKYVFERSIFLAEHFNLLYFDFRGLGKSKGMFSTIGALETKDLNAAVSYLKTRGIETLGIWGLSMGGAVALMASGEIPGVKAVVSEGSYASLDLMANEVFKTLSFVKPTLVSLARFLVKVVVEVDIRDVSPAVSAKNLRIPVLVIHSRADELVPFYHASLIKDALEENIYAEFWFQDDVRHAVAAEGYSERILSFFQKTLN